MDTLRLRQATQQDHSNTETAVPLMGDTLTRDQYVDTLRRFYRVVRAWDTWADTNVPADLRPILHDRRRASLLADDLQTFGQTAPPEAEIPHEAMAQTAGSADPRATFLGRMYVMEGSTLGGQLLARHVEKQLELQPGIGDSYFNGYGDHTGQRWKDFKALLIALPDESADTVIAAAKDMFRIFGQCMTSPQECMTAPDPVAN